LTRCIESEGIGHEGELEVVERAVESLVGEAGVGDSLQQVLTTGQNGFGIVGVEQCVDLKGIGLGELRLGGIGTCGVSIGGSDDGGPLLAERAESSVRNEIVASELLG
jgi:hypothetical protein